MSADRFAAAERIFRLAIAVEASAREAFVRAEAGGDETLERDVLSLLAEDAEAGGLDAPIHDGAAFAAGAGDAGGGWPSGFADSDAGSARDAELPVIPGFRLLRRIGAGGMGVVYEAEQLAPRRSVAVKVMRSAVRGAASWRRFALEAHVLARFQHPGIAQIFGTGTFDGPEGGRPYLAMELVQGEPLTECAAVRALPLEQKLELLAAIGDALQHAHQRGVIHRDLKPANILVTVDESDPSTASAGTGGSGVPRGTASTGGVSVALRPKILDFGVARAVDDAFDGQSAGTLDGQLVGTLPYMSPEQVGGSSGGDGRDGGADVDTRSDLYALGVIAYELLAGRHPHELRGVAPLEAARIIRDVDPPRLGTLDRRLAGDVETIVAKAMEKERGRRYQAASELSADLRRHLRFEPIAARPHSALDHLVRFARRHRVASAMLVATSILLIGGAVVVAFALATATRERDEAVRQAAIARAVNAFVDEDLLGAADAADRDGAFLTVREALDRAAQAVDSGRVEDPSVEAALRSTIGRCYRRLGLLDESEPHLVAALALHRRQAGDHHLDTTEAMNELAKLRTLQGRDDDAIDGYRAVLDAKRAALGDAHPSTIVACDNLARELRRSGRMAESIPFHERAHALATRHLAPDDPARVFAATGLASLRRDQGRLDDAEPLYRDALERSRRIHGSDAQHTLRLMNSLALLEMRRGRQASAEALLLEAIAIAEVRVGRHHPNTLVYLSNLGNLYLDWHDGDRPDGDRLDDAERVLTECVAAHESTLGPTHRGTLLTMTHLMRVLERRGDAGDAAVLRERIAERWIERDGPESPEAAALQEER